MIRFRQIALRRALFGLALLAASGPSMAEVLAPARMMDEACEALSEDRFVFLEIPPQIIEEIGTTEQRLTAAEINAMPDSAYYEWWNAVLNKDAVTRQFDAGDEVISRVIDMAGFNHFAEGAMARLKGQCPTVGMDATVLPNVAQNGRAELGVFPKGVSPVSFGPDPDHVIGLPYDANGDVDLAHPFWDSTENLKAIGIPLKADGSVDQTRLDSDNLIHVAWAMAADLRGRNARAEDILSAEERADAAEERADAAEERADAAEERADAAAERADAAEQIADALENATKD